MSEQEYTRLGSTHVFATVNSVGEVWIATLEGKASTFNATLVTNAICITPAVLDALKRYVAELGKESE